jgi:anti-sigma-K factor RskA
MMTHDEASELLAVFALDAVESEEYERIEAHLAECPRCRAELDAHREVAAALGNSVESLPDGLWDSIARRLPPRHDEVAPPMPLLLREGGVAEDVSETPQFETPQFETPQFETPRFETPRFRTPRSLPSPRTSRGRMVTVAFAAVAAAAVAIVLGLNLAHDNDQISQLEGTHSAVEAALRTPGNHVVNVVNSAHHRVAEFVVVPGGRGYLVKSNLPTLSSKKTYQLWTVNGTRSISLGLLGQSPDQATFTSAGAGTPTTLAITVEPAGGSVYPTGLMFATGTA